MGADGNGFTTLHEFGAHPDGAAPQGGLTFVAPDWLYGTTSGGGQNFFGTIFRIRTSGADYSVRASFGGSNPPLGSRPNDELVDDGSGVLYGSTTGGALGEGVLFRFHLATDFIELLEAFQPPHGNRPSGSPVRVGNALYGTTQEGGAFDEGTLYRRNLEPPFDFETLYSFRDAHGEEPLAGLTHEGGPWIYGTTGFGGENFAGTVFRFTPASGIPDTLLDFDDAGSGGALPRTSLVAGAGGFFGTTSYGGAGTRGQIYWVHRNGGGYRVLYDFATEESGNGELLLDGKRLVGGISRGGTAGHGLIYALPVSLVFLDDFESGDDSTWSLASP
jgi:uncharacterized repeat protein (TIGR03803 family)